MFSISNKFFFLRYHWCKRVVFCKRKSKESPLTWSCMQGWRFCQTPRIRNSCFHCTANANANAAAWVRQSHCCCWQNIRLKRWTTGSEPGDPGLRGVPNELGLCSIWTRRTCISSCLVFILIWFSLYLTPCDMYYLYFCIPLYLYIVWENGKRGTFVELQARLTLGLIADAPALPLIYLSLTEMTWKYLFLPFCLSYIFC